MPFTRRTTRWINTIDLKGWQLKIYTITTGSAIGDDVVAAALSRVAPDLPQVEEPGVGLIIIHCGEQGIWRLCDHWHGDIIMQTVYRADHTAPTDFIAVPHGGPTRLCPRTRSPQPRGSPPHRLHPRSGRTGHSCLPR